MQGTMGSTRASIQTWAVAALAACSMFAAPAFAQTAPKVDRPDVKPGDQWQFKMGGNARAPELDLTWVVTSVTAADIKAMENGKPLLLTTDLNQVESPRRKDSDLRLLSFPLEVGKAWTYVNDYVFKDTGTKGQQKYSVVVLAYEKVRVPAGEFDAFSLKRREPSAEWPTLARSPARVRGRTGMPRRTRDRQGRGQRPVSRPVRHRTDLLQAAALRAAERGGGNAVVCTWTFQESSRREAQVNWCFSSAASFLFCLTSLLATATTALHRTGPLPMGLATSRTCCSDPMDGRRIGSGQAETARGKPSGYMRLVGKESWQDCETRFARTVPRY